ncbi:hypothetical protein M407DRAFT_222942, partial [Tulasnella calospora MUT 4182]
MTALHLASGLEVAVKFISRARIPPEHLVEDPVLGSQVPIEALILRLTGHKGIVKFLDFYQDPTYFYLVCGFPFTASHDLFECIEQHRMLDERRARYVFKQVVDTVAYLESMGISHRDIKDENLVVDSNFNVKLIDFGSAVVRDLNAPEPYYDKFFGTISFASSEILRNQAYRAPPAEIWTLGVLLSFLVTGESPFPDKQHAIDGSPTFVRPDGSRPRLSPECVDL